MEELQNPQLSLLAIPSLPPNAHMSTPTSKRPKGLSTKTEWLGKYELDCGLKPVYSTIDPQVVISASCKFCEFYGSDAVVPTTDPETSESLEAPASGSSSSTSKRRRMSKSGRIKTFSSFRIDNMKKHLKAVHPIKFSEYLACESVTEKLAFFSPTTTPGNTEGLGEHHPSILSTENTKKKDSSMGSSIFDGSSYPRDMVGYGPTPVHPQWPHEAALALQFVVNVEEGGESCVLHRDACSEHLLSDIVGASPLAGVRHMNIESLYEYGSRAGFWRLHRMFSQRQVPVTAFAVGLALERNPLALKAMVDSEWEIASHGYRWLDYQYVTPSVEREHIAKTIGIHERLVGSRPVGFYQGKPNAQTRSHVVREGGFLYDSDAYNDDLPYWTYHERAQVVVPHLVIPYTLSNNDMKFVSPGGFSCGQDFYTSLKDAFDVLLAEGRAGAPKMMSVGLHGRIVGQPGRAKALGDFLDYVATFGQEIWVCRRQEIATHWHKHHYPDEATLEREARKRGLGTTTDRVDDVLVMREV